MFENSVVESRRQRVSARRLSILPLSVMLHLLAIGGAIFAAVWDVELPTTPPAQVSEFILDAAPPIPPAAPPMRRGAPTPEKQPPAQQPIPSEPVAPTTVPDNAPVSDEPSGVGSPDGAIDGDPDGDPNGVPGGIPGGVTLDQPPPIDITVPLRVGGDVKAPVVIHRVDPAYPPLAIRIRLQGSVTVECVIDRDGVVRNTRLVHSTHPLLNDSVVNAVRQWRFRPGTLGGKPVDTIFQLTVRFDLR